MSGKEEEDEVPINEVLDIIGIELERDLNEFKVIFLKNWISTVGDVRKASPDAWKKWDLPSKLEDCIREKIGLKGLQTQDKTSEQNKTSEQKFLSFLFPNTKITLYQALEQILENQDLVLDEIQHQWDIDSTLLTKIIQIVDQLKPKYRLVLAGTPHLGKVDVVFDEHANGRMIKYHLPSLSGIEVYALLNKCLKVPMVFDIFLSLWSCYDGIPGLYELAYNSNAFTHRSINISSVFKILSSFIPLHKTEHEWIQKSSGNGYFIENLAELKDPVLVRLKDIGVLIQQENTIYVRDKILQSFSIASKMDMMEDERLNNIRGYGLESLARSIAPEIFKHLQIKDPSSFVEVARGYGIYDIDAVYSNRYHYILFSCKVNPSLHNVKFLENIEVHFEKEKPYHITLILCSPSEIPRSVFFRFTEERRENNLSWNPYFKIECVDLSQLIPLLSHDVSFLQKEERWPFLTRVTERTNFLNLKHRIVHVIGHRRVGKTSLIRKCLPNAVYVDFKQI